MRGDGLLRRLFQVSDEICPFLWFLQAGEDHLRAGDVLFGVFEVLKKSVFVPCNTWKKNSFDNFDILGVKFRQHNFSQVVLELRQCDKNVMLITE